MKKFLLSMIASVAALAASAGIVYFDNSKANWSKVNIYTFSAETMGTWPGTAMTQGENNIWSVEVTEGCIKIIFNNGSGKQTGNLDYEAGATYNEEGKVGAVDQHIYFKNTANWEKVYIYTWSPEMFGGWPGQEMTANAEGLYEFTYKSAPAGLKFHNNAGTGATGDITSFKDGDIFDATGNLVGDPEVTVPEKLFIIGTLEGSSWDPASPIEMTKEGNKFTAKDVALAGTEDDPATSYFSFLTSTGDWTAANGSDRYGADEKDKSLDVDQPVALRRFPAPCSDANAWKVASGKYDVVADFDDNTMRVSKSTSGIDETFAAEAAATVVYFNLQGVRVANPEAGALYIVKRGDKVTKEIAR